MRLNAVCSAVAAFALSLGGCTCDDNLEASPDAGPAEDAGTPDAAMPCMPTGVVTGKVCAPMAREFLAGAEVSLSTRDCHGEVQLLTATTEMDGSFRMENVPAGMWRMEARSGGFVQPYVVTVEDGQTTSIPLNQLCVAQEVKVAVVTGAGDRIEDLLGTLGVAFDTYDGKDSYSTAAGPFLGNLLAMQAYDIIFINCAAATNHSVVDLGPQAGDISSNLQQYVMGGGSLYASDWAVVFQAIPFPQQVRPRLAGGGAVGLPFDANQLQGYAPQTVTGRVVDSLLASALQKEVVQITFPNETGARSSHWGLLDDQIAGARVLVQGDASTCRAGGQYCDDRTGPGPSVSAPLAVGFKLTPATVRGGNVYYTSFHNVAQQGQDVANILKYIIFHL